MSRARHLTPPRRSSGIDRLLSQHGPTVDKTVIAGVFALIGALVGAGVTARNRRLDAEARARAALEAAVVDYVTALEEVLISLDVLGLRQMPGERHIDRLLDTSVGHVLSSPMRLLIYFLFPALSTTRHSNRLRRASRRLALTADEELLREIKTVERLLDADVKNEAWAHDVLVAARHVTVAARRAITPRRGRLPWRSRTSPEIERLLLLSSDDDATVPAHHR